MRSGDVLKLKWLRLVAINELRVEEHDLIVDFTTRYQKQHTPSFTEEDIHTLGLIYSRVRTITVKRPN